jgi:hypothetical protein
MSSLSKCDTSWRSPSAGFGGSPKIRQRPRLGPCMMGKQDLRRKIAKREDDPEELAIVARQKILTEAMNYLQAWDEEQSEFVISTADPNAPLGDWTGLRRRLTADERERMRKAIQVLAEDAKYVCLGLNGETEATCVKAFDQWLEGLKLPKPGAIIYMDDAQSCGCEDRQELQEEVLEMFKGPIHIGYNSKAGADPLTGDDSMAPAAANMMPYPAPDRGVVFTPILDGFFTQYGDIPLDLFGPDSEADVAAEDEPRDRMEEMLAASTERESDPDIALRQHASMGNLQAVQELQRRQEERRREQQARDQEQTEQS